MTGNAVQPRNPAVAAIVLAAGRSTRTAPANKLLSRNRIGATLISHVVLACLASQAAEVAVVVGHQAPEIEEAIEAALCGTSDWGARLRFVHAEHFAEGLSASLRAGLQSLSPSIEAAIICLGDMPRIGSGLLDLLMAAYRLNSGMSAVVPAWAGQRGNPVLWNRRHFDEISALTGDSGARALLLQHSGRVLEVAAPDDAILLDCDTPETTSLLWRGPDPAEAKNAIIA